MGLLVPRSVCVPRRKRLGYRKCMFVREDAGKDARDPQAGCLRSQMPALPAPALPAPALPAPARHYRNCRGGGGFCESSGPFKPVSDNISLIVPTLESMLAVSTGMKITFALLLLVMSRKLSM